MTINRILAVDRFPAFAFIPAIIWSVVLAFLMLLPGDKFPESELLTLDKVNHLIAYGLLSFLIALAYRLKQVKTIQSSVLVKSVLIAISYSSILEILQYFVPGRALDVFDLMANLIGCLLGILIFNIFQQNKFVRSKLID